MSIAEVTVLSTYGPCEIDKRKVCEAHRSIQMRSDRFCRDIQFKIELVDKGVEVACVNERERIAQAIEAACCHRLGDGTCYRCTHAAQIARGEGRR